MDPRKRAVQACDECRRAKEKCEGGPPCKRCSHFQRVCEFRGPVSKAREFRPYIPRERMTSSDLQELIDRSQYMERILKRTIEGIRLDINSLARMAEALDANGDGACGGSDAKEVEGLLIDDEACTMDPVGDNTTHFSGEFPYWNFSMRLKRHMEQQMGGLEGSHISGPSGVWDFPRAHQLRPGRDRLSAAISCCPPGPIAEFLTRKFFRYAETHYFFVGKAWFVEQMNHLYSDPGSFAKKGGEAIISILLTVFAIGSQYAHFESSTYNSSGSLRQNLSEEDIGATLYQQATHLLPEIIELSSLESVQACLLLGYYALPVDTSGLGYIYVNIAIRLGMQNGMHRRCKNDAFDATMVETRNRVWWTAYLLERKISIFHGRPLSVLRNDVDATIPLYQSTLGFNDTHASVARTDASIKLVHFLEDLFHKVNNLRSCQKQQISTIITHLLTIKAAMKEWWSSLPQEVVNSSLQPPAHVRSVMHLQLEYCLVRMFIGRPFLLRKEYSNSTNNAPAYSENSPDESHTTSNSAGFKHSSSRKDLIDDCIEAATEALRICQELRDSGAGLARASYIEYSSCRASLLVLIAYSIQNPSEQFQKNKLLYNGLGMIRDMSAAGESAQSEVCLIESLERALARLHTGAQQPQQGNIMAPSAYSISDYEAFKHWGATLRDDVMFEAADIATNPSHDQSSFDAQSYDRIMQTNCGQGLFSASDCDMGMLGPLDPLVEIPLFGTENTFPSATWPIWTETQVLEQFLTNPEYGIAHGMDIGEH